MDRILTEPQKRAHIFILSSINKHAGMLIVCTPECVYHIFLNRYENATLVWKIRIFTSKYGNTAKVSWVLFYLPNNTIFCKYHKITIFFLPNANFVCDFPNSVPLRSYCLVTAPIAWRLTQNWLIWVCSAVVSLVFTQRSDKMCWLVSIACITH